MRKRDKKNILEFSWKCRIFVLESYEFGVKLDNTFSLTIFFFAGGCMNRVSYVMRIDHDKKKIINTLAILI